jgi:hypothetical protein
MTFISPHESELLLENPFDFLPFELLEIIFEYLDPDDLRSLIAIPGWLRDVLLVSPISMRKLTLTLNEDWHEKATFVRENGETIKTVCFQHCRFDDPKQFRDLLKCMQNTESLKVANIHISAEVFTRKFRRFFIDLEHLRRLDVDNSQAVGKLTRLYLHDPQVDELRLDFSHFNVTKELVRVLWSQLDLRSLELSGFSEIMLKSLFSHDISYMIRFGLRRLIFNCEIVENSNFFKTLEIFSETLEELEIHKEIEWMEFFKLMLRMKNLRALTLATNFVTLKTFFDCVESARKSFRFDIKELTLVTRSQYGIEQPINFIVEKLGNLETLKVINLKTNASDQFLSHVNLKTLRSLYVENSKPKFLQSIKFENLRSLKLSNIHPFLKADDWGHLFKNNLQLEELILTNFEVYFAVESVKVEITKVLQNLNLLVKNKLKFFEIFQELRYQKPIKVLLRKDGENKVLRASDSFIKICRHEFHALRKMDDFKLIYYADDYFELNNKYLH